MAGMAVKLTKAFLEAQGVKVLPIGEEEGLLIAGFAMDNRDGIMIIMQFDDNDRTAKVLTQNLAKIPESAVDNMYKVVNAINKKYRWIKFYIDEKDNTITASDDVIIQLDSCGEEIFQCCLQLVHIADEAYPEIMKGIYS